MTPHTTYIERAPASLLHGAVVAYRKTISNPYKAPEKPPVPYVKSEARIALEAALEGLGK